jgi:hypothetical protein
MLTNDEDKPSQPPPPPGPSERQRVVFAALAEVGNGDPAKYWADVLPGVDPRGLDWCGAFALWALHQAGLALDRRWVLGRGFILVGPNPLPQTTNPKPGDIAYFTKNQHEAIVEFVSPGAVQLINGNGQGGRVSVSTVPRSSVTAFFSIAPLLSSTPNV